MGKYSKKKRPGSTKRVLLILLCVILAVILAGMLLVTAYVDNLFRLLGRAGRDDPSFGTGPTDPSAGTVGGETLPSATVPIVGEEHINILLIGNDSRGGDSAPRSDSMILCTFNTKTKTITMTSFLRDVYVQIPGFWSDKLTHAFHWGAYYGTSRHAENGSIASAIQVLDNTLSYNFGVQVDGNLCVDFAAFEAVIDQVGGVDIELTGAEASHLNQTYGFSLTSGVNHLNGAEALGYARIRNIDSDIVRANRQRTVIAALIEKARGMSLGDMNNLLVEVLPLLTTDMTDRQIVNYVLALFPMLSSCKVVSQQFPMEGTYHFDTIDGMAVEVIDDLDANLEMLRRSFDA